MKSIIIVFAIAIAIANAIAQATPLQLRWSAEISDPKPHRTLIWRGETVGLNATLTQYGKPLTLTTNATATLYWQTPDMGSAWWSTAAAISTSGVAAATWTPAMDSGADLYSFFLGVEESDALTYRAYGQLRMQAAPGATPNEIDLPTRWIDFDLIDVLNAPWATPADVATATAGMLTSEEDPTAFPIATNALAVALAALPVDADGAVTIGSRGVGDVGPDSLSVGFGNIASGPGSVVFGSQARVYGTLGFGAGDGVEVDGDAGVAVGLNTVAGPYAVASGNRSIASGAGSFAGGHRAHATHVGSWVWQGSEYGVEAPYASSGPGTFSVAPVGGLSGFLVGNTALSTTLAGKADADALGRWSDVATNLVYHVVVSNGHWLIISSEAQ